MPRVLPELSPALVPGSQLRLRGAKRSGNAWGCCLVFPIVRHSLWFGQDQNPNQFPNSLASTVGRTHRGARRENSLGFLPWEPGTVCPHIWAPGWGGRGCKCKGWARCTAACWHGSVCEFPKQSAGTSMTRLGAGVRGTAQIVWVSAPETFPRTRGAQGLSDALGSTDLPGWCHRWQPSLSLGGNTRPVMQEKQRTIQGEAALGFREVGPSGKDWECSPWE